MIAGWVPPVVCSLLVIGALLVPIGACFAFRGPDSLVALLTGGGVVLFVSGLLLAVGAVMLA